MKIKRTTLVILLFLMFVPFAASKKRALVIGIGQYPKSSGWAVINGDKDIPVVVEMLNINGFSNKDIAILCNEQATKKSIRKAMQQLAENSQKGDHVYIHFSGHGQQVSDVHGDEDDGMDEAWIPYDAEARYEAGKYEGENHILDDELYILFSSIADKIGPTGHLSISVDACHSGDSSRGLDDDSVCVRGAFADGTRGIGTFFTTLRDCIVGENVPTKDRVVRWTMLSACKSEQTNREYNGGGSLTAALREIANELENMTAEEVRVKVRNWMRERFGDHQLPVINPEKKNISFL